ncbi:cytochrome c oxidase assembly protein COX20, mitochondrial [Thalassophryne amazonica]|uniref:cytochrome c oxidase assembly protein COX20, mitochondrial n=1 Tax=Thalassophryne amazonica TaxID=390379 RepID=UPI001471EDC2|nr:cytochrome c oxidase assembly protein COX20, mitochondrial [Thalassophryne amazonica]
MRDVSCGLKSDSNKESIDKRGCKMSREEDDSKSKAFRLPEALDIRKFPCVRNAVLHGAGGSVVFGLLHFLFTSRVRRSFDVGYAGFLVTTLSSWVYCHFKTFQLLVEKKQTQYAIKNKLLYEGTSLDPTKKATEQSTAQVPPEST